jgi:molybdopterin-containing oxidoreductase family iron-sulfur binding subunit
MPPVEPKTYWRSLDELNGPAAGDGNEFPPGVTDAPDGASRRDFLKLLGGTAALAGVAGCRNPPDKVLPYAKQPAEIIPGNPLHYATTLTRDGYGLGVVVAAREGRPIKIEGNPDHPASLGATGPIEQAQVWHLYDPQRARTLKRGGKPHAWSKLITELAHKADALKADGGAKLAFLVEPDASPLHAWLRQQLLAKFPHARFFGWSAAGAGYAGTQLGFGKPLETRYDFDKARVIVSLDADFLSEGPFAVRYHRQFAEHRVPQNELNRLYTVESGFSGTGVIADHRLRVKPSEVLDVAVALANLIKPGSAPADRAGRFASDKLVQAMASDLKKRGAASVVVAGARQPAVVQALAAVINASLGSQCVGYTAPIHADTSWGVESLQALSDEVSNGRVETLVVTAWNPVYSAPADIDVAAILRKTDSIYRSMFEDETARHAGWFVPATHELEEWGDARAVDGTVSLRQPLIQPLFGGISTTDLYAALLGNAARGSLRLLRDSWQTKHTGLDFERWWSHTVQNGIVEGTALPAQQMTPTGDLGGAIAAVPRVSDGLEISFTVDNKVRDGRMGDCAWLQELPHPMTKVTWGNPVIVGTATAKKLGVETDDLVELAANGRSVRSPVFVLPGVADDVIEIAVGYGREGAEMIAREIGANVNPLRLKASPWLAAATIKKTGEQRLVAKTHGHWSMEGRPIALEVDAEELESKKKTVHLQLLEENKEHHESVFPDVKYDGFKWAMSIDMSRCSGCNACMMACASENNILIVGPDQVRKGRDMNWLRIDRYFTGPENDPEAVMQPLMCVHCENAPCEYVCPVNATVHSDEGLNEMVYNRCVGTRYCSNNCPYKVRHFNYFNWHDRLQGTEEMAMNPDVTVRSRGVMEKCTYCVQRIERYRIDQRNQNKGVADWKEGDVVTACAQACPSQAIVFGTLSDEKGRVAKLHDDERAYKLLNELNTRPRTMHLARVRNKNPELG